MANDPTYVRLVDRMARSTQVDLTSGWSIAGLDVRPFPESSEPRAQKYVRDALRRGTLEGCSKAEFEEVYGSEEDGHGNLDFFSKAGYEVEPPKIQGQVQTAQLHGLAEGERHRIEAARGLTSGGESPTDERIRRAAILRAQKAMDGNDDEEVDPADAAGESDDEELREAAGVKQPAKRSSRAASRGKQSAEDSDS